MSFEQLKQQMLMLKQVVKMMDKEQKKTFCMFVIAMMQECLKD